MDHLKNLAKPFPEADIEWRIQRSGVKNGKPWGMVLAYITARAIHDRLDEVCGPEGWQLKYSEFHDGKVCSIGIKCGDEWVWKSGGASNTDIEAFKGGLSSAEKRAGVPWGIGRYLYKLEAGWADFCKDGLYSAKIKDNGKDTWHKWNPPQLPPWALPENSMEKSYAEEKERVIAANYDRDDVEYDYHREKAILISAPDMDTLKQAFGKFFKANQGSIEAQKLLTETYNDRKAELMTPASEGKEQELF